MSQRLDFYASSPAAIKAMVGLEQRIAPFGQLARGCHPFAGVVIGG